LFRAAGYSRRDGVSGLVGREGRINRTWRAVPACG
jgi:hypothetical protein